MEELDVEEAEASPMPGKRSLHQQSYAEKVHLPFLDVYGLWTKQLLDQVICAVAPWSLLTILSLFFLAYRQLWLVVLLGVFCAAVVSLIIAVTGLAARHGSLVLLGVGCFTSTCASVLIGNHINEEYLSYYAEMKRSHAYKNVDASHLAARTLSAGVFEFIPETIVDDHRSIGFIAGGDIHCVAPVATAGRFNSTIQYWATGVNCCEKRWHFDCGTAMHDPRIAVVARKSEFFNKAVIEAESVYNLSSAADAHFVHFVQDPLDVQDQVWDAAVTTILVASLLDLGLMSTLVALIFKAVPNIMSPRGGDAFLKHYIFQAAGKAT